MSPEFITVCVVAIIFFASLVRSTFGFADALIAMPLLDFVVELDVARPLVAMFSVIIALIVIARDFKSIKIASVWRLIVAAVFGIPFGYYILTNVPEAWVKIALGLLLISFAGYNLLKPRLLELKSDRLAWFFGFAAGAIGIAFNTPGPVIVTYGTMRRWPPMEFRARMQAYLLPTATLIMLVHARQGLWTSQVVGYFAFSLPVVLIAIVLGRKLSRKLRAENFSRAIYILLILIGTMMLIRCWQSMGG